MPKVKQYPYLSDEAMALRARDGVPPWGCHVCEVDEFDWLIEDDRTQFFQELQAARRLRAEIEAAPPTARKKRKRPDPTTA